MDQLREYRRMHSHRFSAQLLRPPGARLRVVGATRRTALADTASADAAFESALEWDLAALFAPDPARAVCVRPWAGGVLAVETGAAGRGGLPQCTTGLAEFARSVGVGAAAARRRLRAGYERGLADPPAAGARARRLRWRDARFLCLYAERAYNRLRAAFYAAHFGGWRPPRVGRAFPPEKPVYRAAKRLRAKETPARTPLAVFVARHRYEFGGLPLDLEMDAAPPPGAGEIGRITDVAAGRVAHTIARDAHGGLWACHAGAPTSPTPPPTTPTTTGRSPTTTAAPAAAGAPAGAPAPAHRTRSQSARPGGGGGDARGGAGRGGVLGGRTRKPTPKRPRERREVPRPAKRRAGPARGVAHRPVTRSCAARR